MAVTLWQCDKTPHPNLFVRPACSTHLQMWLETVAERRDGTFHVTPLSGIRGKVIQRQGRTSLRLRLSIFFWFDLTDPLKLHPIVILQLLRIALLEFSQIQCPSVFSIRSKLWSQSMFLSFPTSETPLTLSQSFLWLQLLHRTRRTETKGNKLTRSRSRVLAILSLWLRLPI